MAVYARRLNYLPRQIVHAVEAVSFVQLKGMREIRLQVIEIGRVPQKSRNERNQNHESSFSISAL